MEAPGARLDERLFTTEEARAALSARARLQGMLDFEAALARAQARLGIVPAPAAEAIAACCRAEDYDLAAIAAGAADAGNPALPLIEALAARAAAASPEAARWVHWGATSQDAMDTGLVLQLRAALGAVEADLGGLSEALARLAGRHRATPLAGRTWLQHSPPVTLGLKAAGWWSAVERHRARLAELRPRLLVIQLGGAVGTLAALGPRGLEVAAALAEELGLGLPDLPWHAHRDRLAEAAAAMGLLAGTLGKVGRDLALLAQTEVGEASEPSAPGRGGSSTMPHKRNPVAAAVALAAAVRVPGLVATALAALVQEHERGLGGWQAEWDTLPEIVELTAGSLRRIREAVEGLEVRPERMRANLDLTAGLAMAEGVSMALARELGRLPAHRLVKEACRRALEEGRPLRELLAADPEVAARLSPRELDELLDPARATGLAVALVERALRGRAGR